MQIFLSAFDDIPDPALFIELGGMRLRAPESGVDSSC